ncbi:acetate kinase [Basidiobolus meristosporus CBS 931.73]|uniref:Probable acetate kinase n=1 Tax=Basidiobolus meristosporus CBS 931.73 TaxID=1314790 RepID=A0A1Y1XRM4_9FUNG|nr:acetate kinase [Basidiobolus meristosporus CBS 931.73]|eukprot:ORX88146.1 acetate kinase [Basidiobolus meristosporus CBS 931.73]
MSLVLVLNAGSSSLKYKLLEKSTLNVLAKGNVQDIGSDTKSTISCVVDGRESNKNVDVTDHKLAINELIDHLVDPDQEPKVVKRKEDIVLIGHRVVHGGEQSKPLVIDSKSLRQIDELTELAPLHNHSSVQVIRHCLKIMPHAKNVACFDTMFHRSLPPHVYTYAIPYETTEKKHIRKYGFHGLSYEYITNAASDYLKGKPEDFKFVALHLGSGASICAIRHGQSLDTSMGMTPLEGLMMGTRSGDMDPSVVFHLAHKEEMTNEAPGIEGERFHLTKAEYILNHQSGLKGVAGTSDIREILQLRAQGDGKKSDRARLALEMYVYRAKKYIGAYFAALNGVDAILLCGGVGEKSQEVREGICADLESMGIRLEKSKNREVEERFHNGETVADIGGGKVRILVIQTDEEMQIARTLSAM